MKKDRRTVVLLILDGWGIGKNNQGNPLYIANPKLLNFLPKYYKSGSLQAFGVAVGLPWDEESNSEVGHLILGAGRIIYQHYLRISNAIKDGTFFKNPALLQAVLHAKKNNSAVNIAGLLTAGSVHAALEHLEALIELAQKAGAPKINLHLFTDGKDSAPKSAVGLLKKLNKTDLVASVSGRYYALDRDQHFDRTERAYRAMTGEARAIEAGEIEAEFKSHYEKEFYDQHIEPFLVAPARGIADNDALIFFDFREDSVRQIVEAFIDPKFGKFPVKQFKNLHVVTMTPYSDTFKVPVAFPPEQITKCLAEIVAAAGKTQLHVAETEKYAHVTYFFNAYREEPFEREFRTLIPSRNVARHDEYPTMMAPEISARIIQAIEEGTYDFIVANIANFDMIAHTGNFEAAAETIRIVDAEIEKIWKAVNERNAILVMTSDHGNIEIMLDTNSWLPETKHNSSPVPFYVIGNGFESVNKEKTIENVGLLSDVAPTILELMGIPQPKEMTGQSLIRVLK